MIDLTGSVCHAPDLQRIDGFSYIMHTDNFCTLRYRSKRTGNTAGQALLDGTSRDGADHRLARQARQHGQISWLRNWRVARSKA